GRGAGPPSTPAPRGYAGGGLAELATGKTAAVLPSRVTTLVPARSRTPVTGGHYEARTNRRPARPPAPGLVTLPAVPARPACPGPAGGGAPVTDARRGGLRGRRPHRRSPGRC